MNFNFDNVDAYLTKTISPEAEKKLAQLEANVGSAILTQKERQFIESVKDRIVAERKLTEKQSKWLASIIDKCRRQAAAAECGAGSMSASVYDA